jgi:oxygen-dependent protoporphyrinogen oxidase
VAAGSPPAAGRTALVVGGGISGLLAARELARAGLHTTVLEAAEAWGGCVGRHDVAGLTLDSGAESFATRSTAVADLAAELGLGGHIVAPRPGGAWVQLPGGPRELPKTGVLGIPANPWDPEVRRSLGLAGSLRASLDKLLPASLGTTAEISSVSALVRTRMGRRVLERLVEPVVGGVHSADPGLLDVDMVAPGLRAGIGRHGSLAAAVAAQRKGAQTAPADGAQTHAKPAQAGSAVAGLKGGMHILVTELVADLRARGVQLMPGTAATDAARTPQGWEVAAGEGSYKADVLVVAVDGPSAVRLLGKSVPALAGHQPGPGPVVKLVTLVVDLPALDRRPRGTGILVAPQTEGIRAKALTHATGKWDWVAEAAGRGRHVLRLSYGRSEGTSADAAAAAPGPESASDEALLDMALQDASALLTVPVTREALVGWDVVSWAGALPFAAVGHRQRVAEVRQICAGTDGLLMVGGWLAGNGLAAVVADTRTQVAAFLA